MLSYSCNDDTDFLVQLAKTLLYQMLMLMESKKIVLVGLLMKWSRGSCWHLSPHTRRHCYCCCHQTDGMLRVRAHGSHSQLIETGADCMHRCQTVKTRSFGVFYMQTQYRALHYNASRGKNIGISTAAV